MSTPIAILIAALGGEGGGVLAEWLVAVATEAGYPVQSTSIPGVAQRTGATTYYVEVYPESAATLRGRQPVLSLLPVPGAIDLVVASELLEAVRTVQSGMASPDRTLLIASTSRTLTTVEKLPLGDGRLDSAALLNVARSACRELRAIDLAAIAREAGTAMSAVMLGAIAASGVLPFPRGAFEAVVRASGRGVEASLAGFAGAWDAMHAAAARGDAAGAAAMPTGSSGVPLSEQPDSVAERDRRGEAAVRAPADSGAAATFPPGIRPIVALGHARMIDFQDRAYAELYLDRVGNLLAAERAADAAGAHDLALTREGARFLALWMAFDDIVRVADLKARASRFARVRREVGADPGDVVRIVDYFRPGVPELASMLPRPLASRLAAWDRRRQRRGKPPWSLALALRSDGVGGFVALRSLASLRRLRRLGERYRAEQALIERWLGAVVDATGADWQCGYELALCGRLVKGYGSTNERGKENLIWIIDRLAIGGTFATAPDRARAIRAAREAALADEAGKALDQALLAHGAEARPVKAQPIVWATRPAASRDRAKARQAT